MLPVCSDTFFGHPPPPALHVMELPVGKVYLGAAVTKRCVSSQIWGDKVSEAASIEILCLATPEAEADESEEEITCAALLALDPAIKCSDTAIYASIVVGTSFNRVLSMEVEIEKNENGTFSLHNVGLPPFEPLPLDSPEDSAAGDEASVASMTSDASRHGRRGRSDSFRDSQHASPRRNASLSSSRHGPNKNVSEHHERKPIRFRPSGGVTSVTPYRVSLNHEESLTPVVWIAYGDGATVRVHQGAFFSSVVHDVRYYDLLAKVVSRSRVSLPPSVEGITVLPLPKYHPSPLAPLPPWKPPRQDKSALDSPGGVDLTSDDGDEDPHEDEEEMDDAVPEFHEALTYGGDPNTGMGEQFPALAFYTSENQFVGQVTAEELRRRSTSPDQDVPLLNHVIGGTTALVSGVFGTAFGVVKWGLGQGDKVCSLMLVIYCAAICVLTRASYDHISPRKTMLCLRQKMLTC